MAHKPIIKFRVSGLNDASPPDEWWTADCSCDWHDPYYYGSEEGAQDGFVRHILTLYVPVSWFVRWGD